MASPRFAWGIDIGNRALKAVKLIPSAEGYKVDDFEVIEHETVLSAAGDNRESLIQSAIRESKKGRLALVSAASNPLPAL